MKININKEDDHVSGSEGFEKELWCRRRFCTGVERNHHGSGAGRYVRDPGNQWFRKIHIFELKVDGKEIAGLGQTELSEYRRDNLGYIFQFYNLVPNLTVRENIQVCEYLTKTPLDMDDLLATLGLTEHQNKFPSQLSGGQQQRCAIARALIKNPKLLLCDEPTGALDSKTSRDILVLLETINAKYGTTMLIVTHNNSIKDMVHKVIRIKDGQISKEYCNETRVPAAELEDL